MTSKKRKACEDLAEDENPEKKSKSSDIVKRVRIPNVINFADLDSRNKYNPDIQIESKEGIIFYYHINKLVDIRWFGDKLKESKEGKIKFDFDSTSINLLLNYIENEQKFIETVMTEPFDCAKDTFTNLCDLANSIHISSLEVLCYNVIESRLAIGNIELKHYERYGKDKTSLMRKVLAGEFWTNELFTDEFLSQCFDYGMNHKKADAVVRNILPRYCPTDAQMQSFKREPMDKSFIPRRLQTLCELESFMCSEITLKEFLKKNKQNMDDPKVCKFVFRMAELLF